MAFCDAVLEEAARRGLRLVNLFQFGEVGRFRANFHSDTAAFRFGEAATAAGALELALAHAVDRPGSPRGAAPAVPEPEPAVPLAADLFGDLFG